MKLSPAEIEARLAELRSVYLASLAEKREAVVTHWAGLTQRWQPENYQALYLIIHTLAGSAETFGLPEVTLAARRVVDLFKQHIQHDRLDAHHIPLVTAGIEQLTARMAAATLEKKNSTV